MPQEKACDDATCADDAKQQLCIRKKPLFGTIDSSNNHGQRCKTDILRYKAQTHVGKELQALLTSFTYPNSNNRSVCCANMVLFNNI